MRIRPGTVSDAADLAAFAERTFRETFAADNDPGDMDAYCGTAFGPEIQRGHLADPAVATLIVTGDSGGLMAYAQLRPGAPPGVTCEEPLELWRFYVDVPHQGSGIAGRLMEAVIDAARGRGARTLWLGVWERNTRARAFYRKVGFADVGSHQFLLGRDLQTDLVMARPVG